MDRPWKRIIPPTEDSDSWSSDNDLEQQWISINKRARLSAQANMRGDGIPEADDSENVQNAIDNVLLHHDYAEQNLHRNSAAFRMRHNTALSPTVFDNNTSGQQQRNDLDHLRFDSAISVLQSINNHTPAGSIRSSLFSPPHTVPFTFGTNTQSNNSAIDTSATNGSTSVALSSLSSCDNTLNSLSPLHKRTLELHKKLNFLLSMRKCRFVPSTTETTCVRAIGENEHITAGDASPATDLRHEISSLSLPSTSASESLNSIRDVSIETISHTLTSCNVLPAVIETSPPLDIRPNNIDHGIIQSDIEHLETLEVSNDVNTITVSTTDAVNASNVAIQDTNKTTINPTDNITVQENCDTAPPATDGNTDMSLEEALSDNRQVEAEDSESSVQFLNQGLLTILECPVCWEIITPPIQQCKRGHLICLPCMQRLHSCPTCRSRFTNLRNLAMEKVADKLHYPCKNSHAGCNETMRLVEKPEHEANCMHRIYRCIVSVCPWYGKHPDLMNHMTTEHQEIVVYGDHKYLYISLDGHAASENWILLAHGVIFRVNFVVNTTQGKIHGCVQYVGPRKLASDYIYTFKAESTCGDTKRVFEYTRTTHNDQGKLSAIYNAGDAFLLMRNASSFFSTERHMLIKVTIKHNSEANV